MNLYIYIYLIFFGIILFLLLNHKDNFSIGILNENESCNRGDNCSENGGGGGGAPCLQQCRCTNLTYDQIRRLMVERRAWAIENSDSAALRRPWNIFDDPSILDDGSEENYTCKNVYEPWRFQIKYDCEDGNCVETNGLGQYDTIEECQAVCSVPDSPSGSPSGSPSDSPSGSVISGRPEGLPVEIGIINPGQFVYDTGGECSADIGGSPALQSRCDLNNVQLVYELLQKYPNNMNFNTYAANPGNMPVFISDANCLIDSTIKDAFDNSKVVFLGIANKKWSDAGIMTNYTERYIIFNCQDASLEYRSNINNPMTSISFREIDSYESTNEVKPEIRRLGGVLMQQRHTNYLLLIHTSDGRTLRIKSQNEQVINIIYQLLNALINYAVTYFSELIDINAPNLTTYDNINVNLWNNGAITNLRLLRDAYTNREVVFIGIAHKKWSDAEMTYTERSFVFNFRTRYFEYWDNANYKSGIYIYDIENLEMIREDDKLYVVYGINITVIMEQRARTLQIRSRTERVINDINNVLSQIRLYIYESNKFIIYNTLTTHCNEEFTIFMQNDNYRIVYETLLEDTGMIYDLIYFHQFRYLFETLLNTIQQDMDTEFIIENLIDCMQQVDDIRLY